MFYYNWTHIKVLQHSSELQIFQQVIQHILALLYTRANKMLINSITTERASFKLIISARVETTILTQFIPSHRVKY